MSGARAKGSVAVIGAGLGGLAGAMALLRSGWRVRVYERAPALGEVGAGVTVSSGCGRALATFGLGEALVAASMPSPSVAFVDYRTGALLAGAFDLGHGEDRGLATGRHIHRADLHRILLDAVTALDADAVRTGYELAAIEQDADGVTARFADGGSARADLLVGADGSRSAVRRQLFGDGEPRFAGQVAFRCLIPAEAAAPFLTAGRAVVTVGPARTFHRYPIRAGSVVNVIGIARSESWQQEGWNVRATTEEFLAEFEGFHDDVRGLIRQAAPDTLIKWGLFVRPRLPDWVSGRVALLGDAAHPILPFLGLGAALAMEDGIILARALDAAADADAGFAAYQAARLDRVEAVRLRSIRQGELVQASNPQGAGMAPLDGPSLYDYDPSTVPM